MKYILTITFIYMSTKQDVYAQKGNLVETYDKFFFNIFTKKPDTIVYSFIEKYFPYLIDLTPRKWTIYSSDSIEAKDFEKQIQKTEHNLIFYKHPHFDIEFSEGRLELLSSEAPGFIPRIRKPQLFFKFKSKVDADKALANLLTAFDIDSTDQKVSFEGNRKTVVITDKSKTSIPDSVEFILMEDKKMDSKYEILFRVCEIF